MSQHDRKTGPVRLGRILDGVLSDCGLDARLAERSLLEAWPRIVGERLAANVRAVDVREGVLWLESTHGAWRQEVSLLAPRIINECNAACGEGTVTAIRWTRAWTAPPRTDNDI
jgi:predicted nucleic acid-binding Zn ribbon protein